MENGHQTSYKETVNSAIVELTQQKGLYMSEQFGYGTRFYKTASDDLKSILPDVKSFSPTNLKYMRYFYEMYPDAVICPQVEDELITDANHPQLGDDLQIIFRIP